MLGFNGGTIGIANTVFTGTKSDDPNYSSVSLLLNGNGTNGSTTFTDSSSYGHTVTPNGNAQISTVQSKFGGASMYFDGSGDYLVLPDDQNSFSFGTSDFTLECWIYPTGSVIGNLFSQRGSGMSWRYENSQSVRFFYGNGLGGFSTSNSSVPLNTWSHVALTRNGNTFTIWVNGQSSATNTITASMDYAIPRIGTSITYPAEAFQGYIDDFRITKGVARYASNFTPPTAQLPGGETGTFASGLWTSSDYIKQIRNELWPGANFYTYTLGGLSGKFFNGTWRSTISTGNIGTLPLTTTNESSNVTGSGGMPSADHRYGINLWDYITYTTIGESYGFIAIGYFKPPTTGTYTFYTSSDDYSGVWIGSDALPGATRTTSNAVVNNGMGGSSGQANTKRSGTISLTANTYYPIRIVHEEGSGGDNLTFSWAGPGISETTDLTQYFYSISLGGTLTGNYYGL
jgi:hypothetical protein